MLVHLRGRLGEPRTPDFDPEPIPPEAESNYFAVHCNDWLGPGHPKCVWTPLVGIEVHAVRLDGGVITGDEGWPYADSLVK